MESSLINILEQFGISKATIEILKEEAITSIQVFTSLQEQHMHNLLSKIKIGQHAMLLKAWKQQTALHEVSDKSVHFL